MPSLFRDFSIVLACKFLPPFPIYVEDKKHNKVGDEGTVKVLSLIKEATKREKVDAICSRRTIESKNDVYVVFSDKKKLKVKVEHKRVKRIHSARGLLMTAAWSGALRLETEDFVRDIRKTHSIKVSRSLDSTILKKADLSPKTIQQEKERETNVVFKRASLLQRSCESRSEQTEYEA
uniref:Uncharacterized protein n=1 Tax=Chromera velia CCMP2878 TaxID=1169474 RepID=A0A0G4I3J8_9ALVE|eukprot:Cvel_1769.t1-p1 / transcript=Cvel_1769.t1 / gene=Cvel_1769 / organism=Chromera_velia_CCMP2878 / gene_product=hypothetical protein / transcript_product=hypothetical protein / location=Cvel_scaffold64:151736-152445(+) / protein_length=177 / sequence_SO=supercontig / SO=protein_coding / is_pseudo=false